MGENVMERLTKRSKETTHENGVCCTHFGSMTCFAHNGDCSRGCTWEEAAWSRLAAYEDTGLMPGDVEELIKMATSKTNKGLQLKDELHGMKNELCQYCRKYKQAHNSACDGCRWREK